MTDVLVDDLQRELDDVGEASDVAFVKLFRRWEQQHWQALGVDLEVDRRTCARMPATLLADVQLAVCELGAGDVAVTRLLLPLIENAPRDVWQLYMTTQLSDEARHAMFLSRYHDEVLGGRAAATGAAPEEFYDSGFETEFTPLLTAAVGAASEGAASWHRASTLYHLVTEGVLGVSILKIGRKLTANPRLLPGLAQGVVGLFRDESRHITFGRRAAMAGVAAGHGDAIAAAYETGVRAAARVLVGPARPEAVLAPSSAAQRTRVRGALVAETCERAIRQAQVLRLPLDGARLAAAWDSARDEAIADYAEVHGRAHSLAGPGVAGRA